MVHGEKVAEVQVPENTDDNAVSAFVLYWSVLYHLMSLDRQNMQMYV